jgi:hypothetical protein
LQTAVTRRQQIITRPLTTLFDDVVNSGTSNESAKG